jgi:methylenetetrahydrofolate--tRNA-(uracil-5-)-methyltransferase
MMGALFEFISSASPKHFQPMPPNFGILPTLPTKVRSKQERYGQYRDRSFSDLAEWATQNQVKLHPTRYAELAQEALTQEILAQEAPIKLPLSA